MPETVGDRIYLIRLAHGDGKRTALPMRAFAEKISQSLGADYDPTKVSRQERGLQPVSLEDAAAIAAIDPLRRGPGWLAFGEEAATTRVERVREKPRAGRGRRGA